MLSENVRAQVRRRLEAMEHPVKLVYFRARKSSDFGEETQKLLEEVAGLSEKLSLEIHDFAADADVVGGYGITRVPAIAVVGDRDRGVRVYGIPAGYEFAALLEAILDASRGSSQLEPETIAAVRALDRPVHLEVYVTPT